LRDMSDQPAGGAELAHGPLLELVRVLTWCWLCSCYSFGLVSYAWHQGHYENGSGSLPADAGVFRRLAPWLFPFRSPPRRRWLVPMSVSSDPTFSASSAPTRGCSAIDSGDFRPVTVLPADAGVFRRPRPRTADRRRPPRRRGGVP